jgi:hypothetical protein
MRRRRNKEASKQFFFEKRTKKLLLLGCVPIVLGALQTSKSFSVLFFKKELLASCLPGPRPASPLFPECSNAQQTGDAMPIAWTVAGRPLACETGFGASGWRPA